MNWQHLQQTFRDKRVFLTGHTGFKGAWLLQILHALGADVKGYALAPEHDEDLYNQIGGDDICYTSVIADLREEARLKAELVRFAPHFVFHLAAQPLVRRGYSFPVETFAVNAQGTAHVLDALRMLPQPCVAVMVTTDKVYENPERGEPFTEDDKLGGHDPYSASKAAAEIIISSYQRSYFHPQNFAQHGKAIAAARAGNVIGGGDFSDDRIVPDIVRAIRRLEPVRLRNPASVRPWQHVMESLYGYLMLAAKMTEDGARFSQAYNFGPDPQDFLPVETLTEIFLQRFGTGRYESIAEEGAPHEAKLLTLDSSKAARELGWIPKLNARDAIEWTADWYADKRLAREKCSEQIARYFDVA
jgi:CDP-glucose 4,6-dehydratase